MPSARGELVHHCSHVAAARILIGPYYDLHFAKGATRDSNYREAHPLSTIGTPKDNNATNINLILTSPNTLATAIRNSESLGLEIKNTYD